MVGLLIIFKTGRLVNIYFFIDVTIKKYTLDIHLIELDVVGTSIAHKDSNCFQSSNGGICFSKVKTFNLYISLCYKSCFVPYYYPILILLVSKDPFGSNHIVTLWSLYRFPYLISYEVIQFFMHSVGFINPGSLGDRLPR